MAPRDRAGVALVVFTLLLGALGALQPIVDFDIFYHLAIGDWVLEHERVPRTGLFSATRAGEPWVDGEWGFQVLASALFRHGGWPALVLLNVALLTLALALLACGLARRGVPPEGVVAALVLVHLARAPLLLRPQLVTMVLLAAALILLSDLIDGRGSSGLHARVYAVLVAVWANLHGAFIIGIVAVLLPTAVELLRGLAGRATPARRALVTMSLLATGAAFINPYGWRQVALPFRYALEPAIMDGVREWSPTVLAHTPAFQVLLLAALAAMILAPRRPALHDVVLAFAFVALGLRAHRHVALAALVLAVAAAPSWASLLAAPLAALRPRVRAGLRLLLAALLLAGLLASGATPERNPFRYAWEQVELPVAAADFLLEHRPPGRLFNQYYMGGYLIHRFAPEAAVFIDGRNDLYGAEFARDYQRVMTGAPGFTAILDRYGVGTVLVAWHPNNSRLVGALLEGGWTPVFLSKEDSAGDVRDAILVRDSPEAAPLIERFGRRLAPPGGVIRAGIKLSAPGRSIRRG